LQGATRLAKERKSLDLADANRRPKGQQGIGNKKKKKKKKMMMTMMMMMMMMTTMMMMMMMMMKRRRRRVQILNLFT
jgi:accessory gene regulator protein AgrB